MANPEIIGLLCAGSSFFESGPRRSSGVVLSRSELAGYLAGTSDIAMSFALGCYALDQDAERLLIAYVRVWAAHLANREGWEIVKGRPTVSNLSAIAVYEVIRPLVHMACAGSGYTRDARSGKRVVCSACAGTGIKALSGRKIAAAAGLDKMDWFRHWQNRYLQILKYVIELDGEVQAILADATKPLDVETKKAYKTSY
ncbi:hypothetical protein QZJ86_12135 [Methylomonas montana]|uniref:hypothetical protein n=1 Tax=Methylomonas montana TaxID=3058963 RepID=UPI00265A41A4|nr:hypothetical protein [Methylomonas montana]WKJ88771.1 hypothetical protein QZJ86_12135 [Methylomonas montana]